MTLEDRVVAVILCARDILPDFDALLSFIKTPHEALEGRKPGAVMLASEAGAIEVMAVLGKIAAERIGKLSALSPT